MKKTILIIILSVMFFSCYLFKSTITICIVNDMDEPITSCTWENSDTGESGNVHFYDEYLQPNFGVEFELEPGNYKFTFETELVTYSQDIILQDWYHEYRINLFQRTNE